MPEIREGADVTVHGSSGTPYVLKNVGGVMSCSCPGWRNQSRHPHYRTCKHLCDYRGARDEALRIAPGGRGGHPATVERLVSRYWPSTGAASARMNPEPERDPIPGDIGPAPARGRRRPEPSLPGGASMKYEASTRVRLPASAPPPKPHNAWSAILDDDHPLAEKLPPAPKGEPVNDVVSVKAPAGDEPEWKTAEVKTSIVKSKAPVVPITTPIDPAAVIEAASAPSPIVTGGAFRGVLLAESWDGARNITGWLMSEKLDGVRAYWDGNQFYSRNGNVWSVPAWYREGMPSAHLDGEFWMGRGRFQETSGYCRRMDRGEYWRGIFYQIFDAPSVDAGFEGRLTEIGKSVIIPAHCRVLPHAPCPSVEVLRNYLALVEEQGGEGVMLRRPGSRYVRSRSDSLLKVKTFFDTEARIIGMTAGKGRHVGAVGALKVRVDETITLTAGKKTCTIAGGTEFEVGSGLDDSERRHGAIRVGAIITFRFQELSKEGIPRFPTLIAIRDYE